MPLPDNSIKNEVLKGTKNFIHPKSRKCIAMVRKVKKDSKKERAKQDGKFKQSLLADKLLWFQKHMDLEVAPYTIELTANLIEDYINRNNEELEQIEIKRSIGENRNKQHTGRKDAIRMTAERERGDYESCGLEIPNILNLAECNKLKKWDGNIKFLPNFKLRRFNKKYVDEELKKQEKLTSLENQNILEINSKNTNQKDMKLTLQNKRSVNTLKTHIAQEMETE